MDINKYFEEGSKGSVLATDALNMIDQARQAGMVQQADQMQSGLEAAAKRLQATGGRDSSGFMAQLLAIKGLAPQISESSKRANEINEAVSKINVFGSEIQARGGSVNPKTAEAIQLAAEKGNVTQLSAYSEILSKESASLIENQLKDVAQKPTPEDLAKAQASAAGVEDAIAKKKRQIETIDKYITKEGKPNSVLKSISGVGEGFQNFMGTYSGGLIGNEYEQQAAQDELRSQVVLPDVLNVVQLLKPASQTDVETIYATRPKVTTSPEQWAAYLNRQKGVLNQEIETQSKLLGDASTQSSTAKPSELDREANVKSSVLRLQEEARRKKDLESKGLQQQGPPAP